MQSALYLFWYASVGAAALAAGLLLVKGLFRNYPALFLYISSTVIRSILLISYDPKSPEYAQVWASTEWVLLALLFAVVIEVHGKATARYPGMHDFGRVILLFAVVFALSIGLLFYSFGSLDPRWQIGRVTFIVRRFVTGALAVFVVAEMVFFSNHPIPSRRNFTVYSSTLAFYLFAVAAGQAAASVWPTRADLANVLSYPVIIGSQFSWAFGMTRVGESAPALAEMTARQIDTNEKRLERIEQRIYEFERTVRSSLLSR
jgi:hypothetical protein